MPVNLSLPLEETEEVSYRSVSCHLVADVFSKTVSLFCQVITFQQLTRIRSIIKSSLLPNGISRPPSLYGIAAAGTLTAAHWRTLGLLLMPILLIDFWGGGVANMERPQAIPYLTCYLDLACASRLAFSRTITSDTMEAYRKHHTNYIAAVSLLYKDQSAKSNQHMLAHVPEYMARFGPLVNLSAFTYEGLQGQNQRQHSNHKPSELDLNFPPSIVIRSNFHNMI